MTELERRGKEKGRDPNMFSVWVHVCVWLTPPGESDQRKKAAGSAVNMRVMIGVCRGGEEKAGHSTGRANIHKSKPLKRV